MVPSRSAVSRESPKHPFTKDANAIEVRRDSSHNLQAEIAYRVFSHSSKIRSSIRCPGLRSRPYLILPSNSPTVLCALFDCSLRSRRIALAVRRLNGAKWGWPDIHGSEIDSWQISPATGEQHARSQRARLVRSLSTGSSDGKTGGSTTWISGISFGSWSGASSLSCT
jgi:hypothetical protein